MRNDEVKSDIYSTDIHGYSEIIFATIHLLGFSYAPRMMKVFGQIIKSLFILRYLDELELSQAIEKQLNKVELANRFTRAVAVGNPREYTQAEKEEQEIAEICNRLIKNCIICWNYLYLTQKLNRAENKESKDRLMTAITKHSVVSWVHINLLGEYNFSDEKLQDSVGVLPPKKQH